MKLAIVPFLASALLASSSLAQTTSDTVLFNVLVTAFYGDAGCNPDNFAYANFAYFSTREECVNSVPKTHTIGDVCSPSFNKFTGLVPIADYLSAREPLPFAGQRYNCIPVNTADATSTSFRKTVEDQMHKLANVKPDQLLIVDGFNSSMCLPASHTKRQVYTVDQCFSLPSESRSVKVTQGNDNVARILFYSDPQCATPASDTVDFTKPQEVVPSFTGNCRRVASNSYQLVQLVSDAAITAPTTLITTVFATVLGFVAAL